MVNVEDQRGRGTLLTRSLGRRLYTVILSTALVTNGGVLVPAIIIRTRVRVSFGRRKRLLRSLAWRMPSSNGGEYHRYAVNEGQHGGDLITVERSGNKNG